MKKFFFVLFAMSFFTCNQSGERSAKDEISEPVDPFAFEYTTEASPEWTALFYRKSGWFGGDGIFSFALSGVDFEQSGERDSTLLTFGDTYIGEVENNKPLPGNKMVNNTVAYVIGTDPDPEKIFFHYKKDAEGTPQTFFVPNNENSAPEQYYWGGDGFVNQELGGRLHLFAYHVEMTGPNVFDFVLPNVSLLSIDNPGEPPFENHRQLVTPLHFKNDSIGEGDLGAGVLVNTEWAGAPDPDGYVYVYGCIGPNKTLVAARARPAEFEDFDTWTFWTGEEWSKSIDDIKGIINGTSNELSVTPLKDGRYLLIYQVFGISDKVGMNVGLSPVGPFGPLNEIWTTPEFDEPPGILPYNAKAHPNLSGPGELLISYNTITEDFWNDIQENAHIYRPRFIKLKSEALK